MTRLTPEQELEQGQALFRRMVMPFVRDWADKLVADGKATWILDPEVKGVIGLAHAEDPRRAYVIVYVTGQDFEIDEDALYGTETKLPGPRALSAPKEET